jgi:hypothetical protein
MPVRADTTTADEERVVPAATEDLFWCFIIHRQSGTI